MLGGSGSGPSPPTAVTPGQTSWNLCLLACSYPSSCLFRLLCRCSVHCLFFCRAPWSYPCRRSCRHSPSVSTSSPLNDILLSRLARFSFDLPSIFWGYQDFFRIQSSVTYVDDANLSSSSISAIRISSSQIHPLLHDQSISWKRFLVTVFFPNS